MKAAPAQRWVAARRHLARWINPEGARRADNVCRHLDRLGADLYDQRYSDEGLGTCCYRAVIDYQEHHGKGAAQ